MTTPMTRDEIVHIMAHGAMIPDYKAIEALHALEARGCQIVQGEPVAFMYDNGSHKTTLFNEDIGALASGYTITPLFAGKVLP